MNHFMSHFTIRPGIIPVAVLTALWLLLNNSFSLGHILFGAGLGYWIAASCQPFLIRIPRVRKPFLLCRFVFIVFYDVVRANIQVARLVLGSRQKLKPGFIEVPMKIEDEFVLATLACVISLTPGTVSAGLSQDHKRLLLHALDASDPRGLTREIKERYEGPLMEIFQCSKV